MARQRNKGGRVTPKGGTHPESSTRYTPPKVMAQSAPPSAAWIPGLMSAFLFSGPLVIAGNYVSLWPGSPTNSYLLVGLGLILAGIITATKWH